MYLQADHGLRVGEARELLVDELRGWFSDDEFAMPRATFTPIFKDAGLRAHPPKNDIALALAVEQAENANPVQILAYMNHRSKVIERGS